MKSRSLVFVIVSLLSAVGVAQAGPIDPPKQLETIGAWQSTFRTFAKQSVDRKIQIQKSLPGFASRFVQLLLKTPEYRADRAFVDGLSSRADEVIEGLTEGRISREDARKTLNNLSTEVNTWNEGSTKGLG